MVLGYPCDLFAIVRISIDEHEPFIAVVVLSSWVSGFFVLQVNESVFIKFQQYFNFDSVGPEMFPNGSRARKFCKPMLYATYKVYTIECNSILLLGLTI